MKALPVWVPGEECAGGLLVTDVRTADVLYVTEGETTAFDYPLGRGRFALKKAVRGVLLDSTEDWNLARLPDGREVHFRIVCGWQLGSGTGRRPLPEYDPAQDEFPLEEFELLHLIARHLPAVDPAAPHRVQLRTLRARLDADDPGWRAASLDWAPGAALQVFAAVPAEDPVPLVLLCAPEAVP